MPAANANHLNQLMDVIQVHSPSAQVLIQPTHVLIQRLALVALRA